jgi:hypothetical protein
MNEYKIYIDLDKIDWDTDGSPHNPAASQMYSDITLHFHKELMEDVKELKKKVSVNKRVGAIQITHKIVGKNIRTEYSLADGQQFVVVDTYNSLHKNNGPEQELFLAIARAEINAQMAQIFDKFELHNYPAIGFFMSEKESKKLKNRLRNLAKNPYFMRFR